MFQLIMLAGLSISSPLLDIKLTPSCESCTDWADCVLVLWYCWCEMVRGGLKS